METSLQANDKPDHLPQALAGAGRHRPLPWALLLAHRSRRAGRRAGAGQLLVGRARGRDLARLPPLSPPPPPRGPAGPPRAYVLGERHGVSKMSALGTIAVERVFDGVVLVGFLVVTGAILGLNEELTALAVGLSGASAALLALFVYVASPREGARRWTEWAIGLLPGAVRQ